MKALPIPLVIILLALAGVFKANSQTETNVYSFGSSPNDGDDPDDGLVQGSGGDFYGTTSNGGRYGYGTVFRISPSGSETNLYSFAGSPDGAFPTAGLVRGSDGDFYGTTVQGGTSTNCDGGSCGTVFRISPSGGESILHSFVSSPTDGGEPEAGLVQGSDGNLYGTTYDGGAYYAGTVFRISPSGSLTTLYSFADSPDGALPEATLVQAGDGNFYGTTLYGGTYGYGTVFWISPSSTYSNLCSFAGSNGINPNAALVQASDGNFYGTTESGGSTNINSFATAGYGTVFKISPSGSLTTLYPFSGSPTDGYWPRAGLVQGSDGNFYGTTSYGGTYGAGIVFRISSSGSCTNVYSFGGGFGDGSVPTGMLIQGIDGNLYGTTVYGGTSTNCNGGCGTVFKLAIGGACTYTLNTTSATLAAKGGSKNVSVKVKGTDCAWTAVSNDPFITITSGSNYTGSGKVIYTFPGNTNTTALTGTMTIAGQTFTVNQDAGGCTFKLSPEDGRLNATGGSATIKVKPNFDDCDWTAVSNDSFITITDGTNGVVKGTVTYSVPVNTNTTALTGSIIIGGETFTVTQSGAK
jgi:uncharacterized repeat protein (TIGR03803 family)